MHTQSRSSLTARHACQHLHIPHKHHVRCRASAAAEQSGQHQTAAAAAAASQQQAAAASIRQLLTRRSWAPSRYVGPVNVSVIPGELLGRRLKLLTHSTLRCTGWHSVSVSFAAHVCTQTNKAHIGSPHHAHKHQHHASSLSVQASALA